MKNQNNSNQINYKNYYNQPFGTYAVFKHLTPIESNSISKFFQTKNLKNFFDEYKFISYPKIKEIIKIKSDKKLDFKVGDKKYSSIDFSEFLKRNNFDINFLIKYNEILKKYDENCFKEVFPNYLTVDDFFPNFPDIMNKEIEIEWKIISIEKIDSEIQSEYKDEDSWDLIDVEYDVYKIVWENKTFPHSIYYHFDEGLVRMSNHWGDVGKNHWQLDDRFTNNNNIIKIGFIPWEEIEAYTEEEYKSQFNNEDEEYEDEIEDEDEI